MLNINCLAASREWHNSFVYSAFNTREVGPLRIVVYSHLSPSRLLLSMDTNSLVLKITLKYHGGNHKNRTNGCPSSKREPQTENPILTKTEILTNMGVVCHFLGLSKKRSLIIDPTWRVNRNLGRIKVGSLFLVMKRHLEKLEQKKE